MILIVFSERKLRGKAPEKNRCCLGVGLLELAPPSPRLIGYPRPSLNLLISAGGARNRELRPAIPTGKPLEIRESAVEYPEQSKE